MPELPQMQALAERLDAAIAGARIEQVEALGFSGLKTVLAPGQGIEGDEVLGVGRRAKYLVLRLSSGRRLLAHLSQAGRLDIEVPAKHTKPRGSVVRLVLSTATSARRAGGCSRRERKALSRGSVPSLTRRLSSSSL
jgi:formamidopyrimidine-DNA glycosylase